MSNQEKPTKRVKKMVPTCQICVEPYNKSTRLLVECPYCQYESCRSCVETYILNETTVKCMNPECAKEWSRKHIRSIFTLVFINGPLREHIEKVLFDKERALLPATQPIIEGKIEARKIQGQMDELNTQMNVLYQEISNLRRDHSRLFTEKNNVLNRRPREARAFVRACPEEDCRGFLSSQWKCGICEKWTCPECHVVKGYTRDTPHECNEDDLATARLLATDTKPCPKCATGIFKIDGCFAENTPILLWDGSIKMSQDICSGDLLVGDDGNQRTVLETTKGTDQLYEVSQTNGMTYIVNSKHTLSLQYSGDKSIIWYESEKRWKVKWFDHTTKKQKTKDFKLQDGLNKENAYSSAEEFVNTLHTDSLIDITVDDYMNLDNTVKRNLMGYKNNGIHYPESEQLLEPYMLGLWLGDGIHSRPEISINDKEVIDYINEWCQDNNAEYVYEKNNKYKIRIKQRKYDDKKQSENPLSFMLRKYNLLCNKHIPSNYLINSRKNRLKLLAGIIDSDGHVSSNGKRVTIIQTREILSEQIIFLARSLGFIVNYKIRERKQCIIFNCEPKDYKNQFVINISGNLLSEIPTLISRKKCCNSTPNKDYLRTSIQVKKLEQGVYYGWQITDNHRFILPDFTVVKNCDQMWCTQCHTAFSWRTGNVERTIHNPHYYEWMRRTGGGEMARNPNDVPCGRNLDHYLYESIARILRTKYTNASNLRTIVSRTDKTIRNTIHMMETERPRPPNYERRNEDLRVRYLMNELSEQEMRDQLQKDDKRHHKNQEIADIYTLLGNTITDILFRFAEKLEREKDTKPEMIDDSMLNEINKIVEYANECLIDVSYTYSSPKIVIDNEVRIIRGVRALEYIKKQKEETVAETLTNSFV